VRWEQSSCALKTAVANDGIAVGVVVGVGCGCLASAGRYLECVEGGAVGVLQTPFDHREGAFSMVVGCSTRRQSLEVQHLGAVLACAKIQVRGTAAAAAKDRLKGVVPPLAMTSQ
jgi:hypothetical protein